jgi:hypothetical protein
MYKFYENDQWNIIKKIISLKKKKDIDKVFVKEWQVWWIHLWINVWYETYWKWSDFKRPFLVIKKAWNVFIWAMMTTKWNTESDFYYKIPNEYFEQEAYIIKTQLKSIDKRRFLERMCTDFEEIKKELRDYIFPSSTISPERLS